MSRSKRKIDEIREKVLAMRRGGDLDNLLNRACEELTKAVREEMVAERSHAASAEAGFSPSVVPELRQGVDEQSGQQEAPSRDAER